ncbi:MAG TPA: GxxExxY protein [Chitinophagaceae bacterium]|nr:GxxExxY protein [Chitinophagaceae bacterium]
MIYEQLTHKIISCGYGFQELIYQRALAIEFNYEKLNYSREHEMQIFYRNEEIGTRRVDFFVEDIVMVELKAISHLEDVHLAQAMNYLQAYHLPVGLLINFGAKSLEFKRVYNLSHPTNKDFPKNNPKIN